jgi:antitoxin HicB
MRKSNKHRGADFDDFLRDEAIFDEVQAAALKRALAEAIEEAMKEGELSKVEVARRMGTSRSQLDRVLDPTYTAVQLDTLIKAASAVGRALGVSLKRVADSHPRGRRIPPPVAVRATAKRQ